MRRFVALGIGVALLIIILLGFRACLDARKERGFENYISDLNSAVEGSRQLSEDFFTRLLQPPNNGSPINLDAQIGIDRSGAVGQLRQVESLDVPDELAEPHDEVVQAFELRRDGLTGIAENISTALGEEGRREAIGQIAAEMRAFLASDVLYERARVEIQEALAEQELEASVPPSEFLPPPIDLWLDDIQLTTVLNAFATDAGEDVVRGLELTASRFGQTTLTPDTENTVELGNDLPDLKVAVENQGEVEEPEVIVSYVLSGGPIPLEGESPPLRIDAGGTDEAALAIEETPETGTPYTLEVEILPVPGESIAENNRATYTIVFE